MRRLVVSRALFRGHGLSPLALRRRSRGGRAACPLAAPCPDSFGSLHPPPPHSLSFGLPLPGEGSRRSRCCSRASSTAFSWPTSSPTPPTRWRTGRQRPWPAVLPGRCTEAEVRAAPAVGAAVRRRTSGTVAEAADSEEREARLAKAPGPRVRSRAARTRGCGRDSPTVCPSRAGRAWGWRRGAVRWLGALLTQRGGVGGGRGC